MVLQGLGLVSLTGMPLPHALSRADVCHSLGICAPCSELERAPELKHAWGRGQGHPGASLGALWRADGGRRVVWAAVEESQFSGLPGGCPGGVIAVMQEEMGCKEFPAAQGMLLPRIRASWPQSYCQRWPQRAQNMPQNPQVFSSREMLGCAMNPCVRAHSWLGGDPGLTLLLKAPVFLVVFCFF